MLAIMAGFYNLITPFRGGMAARAFYLKQKHEFSYTHFLATLAASYVLIFLVASVLGLYSIYLIFQSSGEFSWIIFSIFLITFVFMVCIIAFSPDFNKTRYKWVNKGITIINGWNLIKHNTKIILSVIALSTTQLLIGSLMLYYQFKVFDIDISYTSALFISAIGSLGIVLAITPAGLGVSEAITVFSASTIGIDPVQSLSAALLGRAVSIIVLFILGPLFSYLLIKKRNVRLFS